MRWPPAAPARGCWRSPISRPFEGGLPILVDGKIIGAIGVSGVLSAQDAQVARAGLAAVGN